MDPRHDPDLILGHLEGDLTPEDQAKVQALREADPDFAALLDGMANDRHQLRATPAAEPPAGLTDMAMADLERSMLLDDADDGIAMLPPGRRRFPLAPLLIYGGVAAVLALTASAVLKSLQPPTPLPPVAAAPADEAFDIAGETIRTQRDLARRDRAEVGFDSAQTRNADPAAEPATEEISLDTADRAFAESTATPKDSFAAADPPAGTRRQASAAFDDAKGEHHLANRSERAVAAAAPATAATAKRAPSPAPPHPDPAPNSGPTNAQTTALRQAPAANLSETTSALSPAAAPVVAAPTPVEAAPPRPATPPAWLRPIDQPDQAWTRWLTLPPPERNTTAPPAP